MVDQVIFCKCFFLQHKYTNIYAKWKSGVVSLGARAMLGFLRHIVATRLEVGENKMQGKVVENGVRRNI